MNPKLKRLLVDPSFWIFLVSVGEFLWSWQRNDAAGTAGWGTVAILVYLSSVDKMADKKGSE
jgi:hypothetical protein